MTLKRRKALGTFSKIAPSSGDYGVHHRQPQPKPRTKSCSGAREVAILRDGGRSVGVGGGGVLAEEIGETTTSNRHGQNPPSSVYRGRWRLSFAPAETFGIEIELGSMRKCPPVWVPAVARR